jgi:hypothetical protein
MTYEWILSSKPLNMQVSEEVLSRIYVEVAQQQSKHPRSVFWRSPSWDV